MVETKPGIFERPILRKSEKTAQIQINVLNALVLHDIKSRFFGNGLGYLVTMLWPVTHMAVVMGMMIFTRRTQPYGSSMTLYAATGVVPFITFSYISRFTVMGVMTNKSYLSYPIVKPLDIMMARIFLEMVSASFICGGTLLIMSVAGIDVQPQSTSQAGIAVLSAVFLGIGMGVFNSVITMMLPIWNIAYVLMIIIMWATCGVALNPEELPFAIGYFFSFNPLLHCVDWMRMAYYPGFPARLFSPTYLLTFAAANLCLGLVIEKVFREVVIRPR